MKNKLKNDFTCKIWIEKRVTKRKDGAQRNLSIKIFFKTIPKSEFVALKLSKKKKNVTTQSTFDSPSYLISELTKLES
jgi:hypothetical protein